MPHWIFVISNTDKEFERRMEKKEWPIFTFTSNRNRLLPEDKVVFYKAGEYGKKFLGTATVCSKIIQRIGEIDFFVTLKDIDVWKKPISMYLLVSKLELIKNRERWGRHFQGGIRTISKKDYETVLNEVDLC